MPSTRILEELIFHRVDIPGSYKIISPAKATLVLVILRIGLLFLKTGRLLHELVSTVESSYSSCQLAGLANWYLINIHM